MKEWPSLTATGRRSPGTPQDSRRQLFENAAGQTFVSDFDIGSEPHHQQAFTEYERTFGRGHAFSFTHFPAFNPGDQQKKDAFAQYRDLANQVRFMTLAGNEEQVAAFIGALAGFRARHQWLYQDVPGPGKTIKFTVKSVDAAPEAP